MVHICVCPQHTHITISTTTVAASAAGGSTMALASAITIILSSVSSRHHVRQQLPGGQETSLSLCNLILVVAQGKSCIG